MSIDSVKGIPNMSEEKLKRKRQQEQERGCPS